MQNTLQNPGNINRDDQEIIQAGLAGDRVSLEELVQRHHASVYRMALRLARNPERAEDLAQDAWVKALRYLPSFEGRSAFTSWMYTIVRSVYFGQEELAWRRREVGVGVVPEGRFGASQPDQPQAIYERTEDVARLHRALQGLPRDQKAVLELRMAGLSFQDIARQTGVAGATARTRAHRALQRLRVAML